MSSPRLAALPPATGRAPASSSRNGRRSERSKTCWRLAWWVASIAIPFAHHRQSRRDATPDRAPTEKMRSPEISDTSSGFVHGPHAPARTSARREAGGYFRTAEADDDQTTVRRPRYVPIMSTTPRTLRHVPVPGAAVGRLRLTSCNSALRWPMAGSGLLPPQDAPRGWIRGASPVVKRRRELECLVEE